MSKYVLEQMVAVEINGKWYGLNAAITEITKVNEDGTYETDQLLPSGKHFINRDVPASRLKPSTAPNPHMCLDRR